MKVRGRLDKMSGWRHILIAVCIGMLSFVLSGQVSAMAATYYVSPSGSDNTSGTSISPFRTIQHAADIVNPGDTVIIEDGVYTDTNGDGIILNVNRGGNSSSWITFKAQNKWGAVLDGQNNSTGYGVLFGSGANYVRIEGLEIKGCADSGIHDNSSGHDLYFYGNSIHDIGRLCTNSDYGNDGIYLGSGTANTTADSNVIYNIGRLSCGGPYDFNHDHGIYISGSTNDTVINNIFYNNTSGWDIQLYGGTQKNINIVGNTFAFPNPNRSGHIIIYGTQNIVIADNIFYEPTSEAINASCGEITGLTLQNNLTTTNSLGIEGCGGTISGNITGTDPLFVNPGGDDFHLQSSSPAIGAGIAWSGRTYDADANGLSGNPSIGAFEFAQSASSSSGSSSGSGGSGTTPSSGSQGSTTPAGNTQPTTSPTGSQAPSGLQNSASSSPAGPQGSSSSATPQIVYPVNGQRVGTTITFRWRMPANSHFRYRLMYSKNANFSSSTLIQVASSKGTASNSGLGAYAAGLLLFGMAFTGTTGRKKIRLFLALVILASAFLVSCGGGGSSSSPSAAVNNPVNSGASTSDVTYTVSGLDSSSTYYWKVVVQDDNGQTISESPVSSFTTQ